VSILYFARVSYTRDYFLSAVCAKQQHMWERWEIHEKFAVTLKKRDNLEDLVIDGRILVRWILNMYG
jgi:hypothetical protein